MLYIYFGQNVCFQTASTACDARKNLDLLEHVSHHFLFNSSNCNICFSFSSSLSLRLLSVINRHFKSTFYFVKKYHDCRAFRFVFFLLFLYISIFDFVRNRLFAQSVSFFRIGSHMFSNCSPPDTPLSPEHDTEFRDQDYPSFQDEASFEEQPPAELFGLEFDNNVNCLDQDQSDACSVQSPDEHVVGQNRLSDDDEDRSRSTEQLAEDYEQEQEPAANEKTDSNDSIEEGEASDSDDPLMNDEQKKVETCRRPTDEELEDGEVIDDDEGEADNDALNKGGKISTATAAHKRDIEMRNNYGRNYYPQSNDRHAYENSRPEMWLPPGPPEPAIHVNAWERGVRHAKEMINGDCPQNRVPNYSYYHEHSNRNHEMYLERPFMRDEDGSRHSNDRYSDARYGGRDSRSYSSDGPSVSLDRYGQPIRCSNSEQSSNHNRSSENWDAEYERRRRLAYESAPWNQSSNRFDDSYDQRDEFGRNRRPPPPPSTYHRLPPPPPPSPPHHDRRSQSPSLSEKSYHRSNDPHRSPAHHSRSYSRYRNENDRSRTHSRSRSWSESTDSSRSSSTSSRDSNEKSDVRYKHERNPYVLSPEERKKQEGTSNGYKSQEQSLSQDNMYKANVTKKTLYSTAKRTESATETAKKHSRQPIKISFMKTQATLRRDDRLLDELSSADDGDSNPGGSECEPTDANSFKRVRSEDDDADTSKDTLLKQLRAVEEAIARKRAKLD